MSPVDFVEGPRSLRGQDWRYVLWSHCAWRGVVVALDPTSDLSRSFLLRFFGHPPNRMSRVRAIRIRAM